MARFFCFLAAFWWITGTVSLPVAAECTGRNLIDTLPAGERAQLSQRSAEVPYGQGLL